MSAAIPTSPSTSRRRRWPTSSSCSPRSPRCCSWGACSAGSSSAPGASWFRCGRPSSTRSTPSCSGAAATSPRKARSTSPVGTSSTCRPVSPASSPHGSSGPGSYEIDSTPCPTTWSWRRSVPESCGSVGTASTVVTRTTPVPSMAGAVVNTNLATAVGVLTWIAMDAWLSKERKPTFLGGVNGMICGLVGITPCAGWVSGWGAIIVGATCTVVWFAWNYLSKVRPFSKVDDALGVIYTHGIAGLLGGLLLGIFGDPNMIEYGCGHLNSAGQVVNAAAKPRRRSAVRHGQGGVYALRCRRSGVHRIGPPAVGTVPGGHLRHLLVGAGDLRPHEAHRAGPRWSPLQGRDPRSRRPGHPRRGSLPGGLLRHPERRCLRPGRPRESSSPTTVSSEPSTPPDAGS